MSWAEAVRLWLPTALVVVISGLALIEAVLLPERARSIFLWSAGVVLFGALAIFATAWQRQAVEQALSRQAAEIESFWSRLTKIGSLLPPGSPSDPQAIADQAAAAIIRLNKQVKDLQSEIKELRKKYQARTVDDATAAKMTEYLHQFGGHRVVLSCVPGDVEAFDYATQIANILRAADWDALGPEATAIFGAAPVMGISLYVHGAQVPEAAKILLDAFAKFNIPYQTRIAPSEAIPDTETVELFVGPKPDAR